jgi:hypothetical protein
MQSSGKACGRGRAAPARAGSKSRRTREAIRHKIRTKSDNIGQKRAYWTAAEDRAVDRFARAVVRHEYHDATAAAADCSGALARLRPYHARTTRTVAARIGVRALAFGRKKIHVIWTPEEWRLLKELARKVSSGGFREVRQAARAFAAEMKRRRKGWAPGARPIPVRTIAAIDRKLRVVARESDLAWGFREWSPEEDRVVDRFIGRYSSGRFRSFRSAARACQAVLKRLDAARQRHPASGRPYGRSFSAIKQHLNERAVKRGIPMPLFRRWTDAEQRVAARYADRFAAGEGWRDKLSIAAALQRELGRLGYERTVQACRAEIGRALHRPARAR